MRINTGSAKGTRLETLEGNDTRPTSEKVKEAVFSAIQFNIGGRHVLDLFCGCGQLGLEALSRGAERAVLVDSSRAAVEITKRNAQRTHLFSQCVVFASDYKAYLKATKDKFNLIFLDPPYKSDDLADAIKRIVEGGLLADGGYIVCECENPDPVTCEGLNVFRHSKYGRAYVTILEKE
jgi:16S rRNA (guanine(966)-N(2))-methyltransferase RsmD